MHRLVYNYQLYVDNSYKNPASSPLSSRLVQSAAHVSSTPRVLKCTLSLTDANRSHSSQLRAVALLFFPGKRWNQPSHVVCLPPPLLCHAPAPVTHRDPLRTPELVYYSKWGHWGLWVYIKAFSTLPSSENGHIWGLGYPAIPLHGNFYCQERHQE